jgi:hypothetical protein
MDAQQFDTLARILALGVSRRAALTGLLGILATFTLRPRVESAGKKGKKRKKCRGNKTKCGHGCCLTTGAEPDCCPSGKGKRCTNLDSDPANCGSCGNACAAGKVCVRGLCWDLCPEASGCFGAKLCNTNDLCVEINGVAVCAVGGNCFALTDCSTDPTICPAGSACAAICCGNASATCRSPA